MTNFEIIIVAIIYLVAAVLAVCFYKRAERIRKMSFEDYLKQKEERQKKNNAKISKNMSD